MTRTKVNHQYERPATVFWVASIEPDTSITLLAGPLLTRQAAEDIITNMMIDSDGLCGDRTVVEQKIIVTLDLDACP